MKELAIVLFSLLLPAAAALARQPPYSSSNPIRLHSGDSAAANDFEVLNCRSWRLAVETNNIRDWPVVPGMCLGHVGRYLLYPILEGDSQYNLDLRLTVELALEYLASLTPNKQRNDTWVFGLTSTLISNLQYYVYDDIPFGGMAFNEEKYYQWFETADMPTVSYVQDLFNAVKNKGFKIVIISGVWESYRSVVESQLATLNYVGWEKLVLRPKSMTKTGVFKAGAREDLRASGYNAVAFVGDQWIDFPYGLYKRDRIFKLPNSVYYVS